uniref:Mab-21-like HhH/H2TH-like domain-containing protein n=1 Tax=Clytia hemisphaerica TaxID=252671 RepID=A0A7M5V2R0_9CNID
KTDPREWQESHIEGCFHNFLDYVINAIQSRECWNFWLIGINLFQNMTEKDVKKLLRVCKKPTDYIERLVARGDQQTSIPEEKIISRREPRLRSYGTFVYWA